MKNNQISLALAGVMFISIFLPFMKVFALERSLFELTTQGDPGGFTISLLILILLFSVLSFIKEYLYARICSGLIFLACLFFPVEFLFGSDNIFTHTFNYWSEFLSFGAYTIIISSVLGIIFINPNNK